jgi:hypothetical protein
MMGEIQLGKGPWPKSTLVNKLGLAGTPAHDPYLRYLEGCKPEACKDATEFFTLFIDLIDYFSRDDPPQTEAAQRTIGEYTRHVLNSDLAFSAGSGSVAQRSGGTRELKAENAVFNIIGLWLAMPSYFAPAGGAGPSPYETSDWGHRRSHGYILEAAPSPRHRGAYGPVDLLESAYIGAGELNCAMLSEYAGVRIEWTTDVCRHLCLSKRRGFSTLDVFALPTFLESRCSRLAGLDDAFRGEVKATYALLFYPHGTKKHGGLLSTLVGRRYWCLCSACRSWRIRRRAIEALLESPYHEERSNAELDPYLEWNMDRESEEWNPERFNRLWPRIQYLHHFQQHAKPWSLWVLFQDRRDTVQWWTFL